MQNYPGAMAGMQQQMPQMSMQGNIPVPMQMQQQQQQYQLAAQQHARGGSVPVQALQPVPPTTAFKRNIGGTEIGHTQSAADVFKQYKRKRPTDRSLPTALLSHDKALLSLSQEYEKLLEYEKNVDSIYARKKLELTEESMASKRTVWKRLRVRISNTCDNQPWQSENDKEGGKEDDKPNFDSGKGLPSWTVKIEGKLLDLEGVSSAPEQENELLPRFSQLVHHLSVDIHRPEGSYREPALINWQPKIGNTNIMDGFTFTRTGTEALPLTISLYIMQQARRYKVAPELGDLINVREETRLGIIGAMWAYIQREKLLEVPPAGTASSANDDRRNIRCDERMQRLFNAPKIPFFQLNELINRFIAPADPIVLNYTVDVSSTCETTSQTQDIILELVDPFPKTAHSILQALSPAAPTTQEIIKLDETLATSVPTIRGLAYQHALYTKFATNPVSFMKDWMESQSYDLETLLDGSNSGRGLDGEFKGERLRDSDWFRSEAVKDAVNLYIARSQGVPK